MNEFGVSPRRNTLDGGGQGLSAHFESHLVVTLACGSVGNVFRALFRSDAHHLLGDAWSGNGSSQQVSSFVNSVGLDQIEDVVSHKFLSEVSDDALAGTDREGLGLDRREIFLELTDVRTKGDDVEALFAEPFQDDRGIKTSGVGKDELWLGFSHCAGYFKWVWTRK